MSLKTIFPEIPDSVRERIENAELSEGETIRRGIPEGKGFSVGIYPTGHGS